jgi:prepilin-type N-terminal cleavage/methylation domain-containing protein
MSRLLQRSRGFTLLEVIVALAIALPALILMYRQGAVALDVSGSAIAYQEAISRARSRLDALVDSALVPGDRNGEDGGAFRWRTRIVPVATAAPSRETPRRSPYAAGTALYDVSVQISWRGGRGPQSLTLQTRRLGPAAEQAP